MGDYTDDPVILCATCREKFQPKMTFETREGDEEQCPHCQATLVCEDIVYSRQWRWIAKETAK